MEIWIDLIPSKEALEAVILQIHYYNNFRIHTTLKMSPVEFAKLQTKS